MATSRDFADYCCELLSGVGSPVAKRMFGGWSIYIDGMSIAWIIDLTPKGTGNNEKLYLKASDDTRAQYEAAGCQRFIYEAKGVEKSVNYYTAPDEAMESPDAMLPWARLAFGCALQAKAKAKPKKPTNKPLQPVVKKTASKKA
ncbi:MAG: TfoX/Sxy family protein [Burkholderiaceae bacterium]|nr:TfoX/Sxy family protein [Burkholderiaceae bacterium]